MSKGLSVVVKNEQEFNRMKEFLGDCLYMNWVPQMSEVETGIIVHYYDNDFYSPGSVGSSEYQKKNGVRLVDFSDFFKIKK